MWAYIIDPSRFIEWQQGVVDGRMQGSEPHTEGDRCLMTRRIGVATRTSTSELVQHDPPSAWRMRGVDGPVLAAVDVLVEQLTETRSQLTIAVDFGGHGVGRVLVPLVVGHRPARRCSRTWRPPSRTSKLVADRPPLPPACRAHDEERRRRATSRRKLPPDLARSRP